MLLAFTVGGDVEVAAALRREQWYDQRAAAEHWNPTGNDASRYGTDHTVDDHSKICSTVTATVSDGRPDGQRRFLLNGWSNVTTIA